MRTMKLFLLTNTWIYFMKDNLRGRKLDHDFCISQTDRSYLLSTLTGCNYYKEQREVLLTKLSETCKLGAKVLNSYSYLDVKLQQVYAEKV